ncbi:hypothetical protein BJX76DRAFT_326905 [Aspergillus varians]
MCSSSIWISLFIENCLSSYETRRPDVGLNWEDDGSNIRFSSPTLQHALINSWKDRTDVPIANLTDSETQIDAFLSRESLEEYGRGFPSRPLSKDGCRGYFIQLADFELVYEYSTGKPNVHLYVKRFSIVWERDKIKAPPIGKSAAKKPALTILIRRVFLSIKSRNQRRQEIADTPADSNGHENEHGDIPATQITNGHIIHSAPDDLMSQWPSRASVNVPDNIQNHDTVSSGKLLEYLAQTRASGDRHPSREMSIDARPLNPESATEVRRMFPSDNESCRSHEPQRRKSAVRSDESPRDENINSKPSGYRPSADQPAPHESAREVITRTNTTPHPPEKSAERLEFSYSPDKQLNAQLEASQNVTPRASNPEKIETSNTVDPWEGMTEIRRIDVTVPKDQKELLEPDRKPWYPPPVGEQIVSGHVPPALLDEWNKLVLQRHLQGANRRSKSVDDDHLSTPTTPSAESSSDSSLATDWEPSPERIPRRGVLPQDSSPVKDDSVDPRPPQSKSPTAHNGHAKITIPQSQDAEENNLASQPNEGRSLKTPPRALEVENNELSTGDITADMAHEYDGGHESEGSNSDSEMDVSVPRPLSGSSPQRMSSQAEVTVSSLEPSLPESARQNVQVVESPAAVLDKSRPAILDKNGFSPGNVELRPQADQSSSQSRVLNTYASYDESIKGEASQESSKSLSTTGPDARKPVLVMGTPFSSEVLPTQPTPWSGSNSLWTSSGPKIVEGSVAAASTYQSQSSNAFSSYRSLPPSSMLSVEDDERNQTVQSSARGTPLMKIDRVSPVKRFASEIADIEYGSPSKRSKVDRKQSALQLQGGLDERIISRRQNYIISSAQSIEARRVYEKFCNDYPSYAGDFAHFTRLCSRLLAVRQGGSLQRSFLWDDFIIKHLETYPPYIDECLSHETKYLNYEEYFVSCFSRPTYKKRNLTVEGISACAAQVILIDESNDSLGPMTDMKTSFTGSLTDQFSNFHAHSFTGTHDPFSHDGQSEDGQSDTDAEWNPSQYSIPDSEPARAAARQSFDEDMNLDHITEKAIAAVHEDNNKDMEVDHAAQEISTTAITQENDDEDMEDIDLDDPIHETASVELGDDEPAAESEVPESPLPKPAASDAASDTAIESDNDTDTNGPVNENWFLSLRHIYPTTPVWSDDPNTPFKKWARADQNVLSVRNRRGGVYVPVDEKGVIQRIPRG